MRRLLLVLTMVGSLSAGAFVHADDLIVSRFGDYLDALRDQAGIPGLGVVLIKTGEPDWERGLGLADVEHAVAARPDTPFQLDGSTQMLTAALVLRCVEEGRLLLDDPIGLYAPGSPDPNVTIRQLLSHTAGSPDRLVFSYDPSRLNALAGAIGACTKNPLRPSYGDLLDHLAMIDSVPGADVVNLVPPAEGSTRADLNRYTDLLARMARPYAVDARGKATLSQYAGNTLSPAGGLITSARDLAQFDKALRAGVLIGPGTLDAAWTAPVGASGQRLPHGLGWFVQTYNGERIVWQFGVADNASSSLIITIPGRGTTLILLANSSGLARPFSLAAGDVTVSPFARLFLSLYMR